MSKKTYASFHGSCRMKERIGFIKNDKAHLNKVIQNGTTKKDYKGDFYYYILDKEKRKDKKIKIYKNFIYIFNKASHGLITVYPIPEEFLPLEQYEFNDKEKEIINNISLYGRSSMDITTKNEMFSGMIYFIENKPLDSLEIILDDETDFMINIKDIININCNICKYSF